jgi:alkanesulfonate monooxygenase SsuD/methylene tetrahydromethanopterin reductase-like flavin-dependent oxidoreductase (luciferase family)
MLDEATTVIKTLWSGEPVTSKGKYYQLDHAETYPLPFEGTPKIIMGVKGKKTLGLVAKHADEWNCAYFGVEAFREKSRELDEACHAIGRDPASLRRSLMTPFIIGKDEVVQQNRVEAHNRTFPDLPTTLKDWLSAGFLGGSGTQLVDQLGAFVEAGVDRFTLQHNDLDDLDSLELLADSVLGHF